LLLTLIALVLGVAAVIQIGRGLSAGSGRLRIAVLVLVGARVVAVGSNWDGQSQYSATATLTAEIRFVR
jgi:hypothetical protein